MNNRITCKLCKGYSMELWSKAIDEEYHTSSSEFQYYECTDCHLLQIDPMPVDQLNIIYPSNYYSFQSQGKSFVNSIKEWLDKRLFTKLLSEIPGDSLKVMDVGGGSGWLLDTMKSIDKRIEFTQVVDLDEKAEAIATEKGHHYFQGRIEDFETEIKFDFILMLNLIEHVADPLELMKKLKDFLTPNGIILLKTPNYKSLDARLFRNKYWGGLHTPRHWVIFSETSFKKMIENAKLTIHSLSYTQGAPFWTTALLAQMNKRKIVKISAESPAYKHKLFSVFLGLFSGFDFFRKLFGAKTSQMFIVLKK